MSRGCQRAAAAPQQAPTSAPSCICPPRANVLIHPSPPMPARRCRWTSPRSTAAAASRRCALRACAWRSGTTMCARWRSWRCRQGRLFIRLVLLVHRSVPLLACCACSGAGGIWCTCVASRWRAAGCAPALPAAAPSSRGPRNGKPPTHPRPPALPPPSPSPPPQFFITADRPNVAGLVLAGSADFKTELSQSDMFDPRLQAVVLAVVDVSYGGRSSLGAAAVCCLQVGRGVRGCAAVRPACMHPCLHVARAHARVPYQFPAGGAQP